MIFLVQNFCNNHMQHGSIKHINVRYHFLHIDERIEVKKIETKVNLVNVFLKSFLEKKSHALFVELDC